MRRASNESLWLAVLPVTVVCAACVFSPSVPAPPPSEPLPGESIRALEQGITTQAQVVEW